MAMIPQLSLFSWRDIDSASDLDRLKLVIEVMPDEDWFGHSKITVDGAGTTTRYRPCSTVVTQALSTIMFL